MATIEHEGFTIDSNHETEAAMRAAMGVETPEPSPQEAAEGSSEPQESQEPETAPPQEAAESRTEPQEAADRRAKPRENVQARISQAVAKQREAERKAADLEARLQALEQTRSQPAREEPKPVPVAAPSGKPTWKAFEEQIGTQFETWGDASDAYQDARETWLRQQWQEEQAQQRQVQHRERIAQAAAQKYGVESYQQAIDTVNQALKTAGVRITETFRQAIDGSTVAPDLVYWLGTHPDECIQLASETQDLGAAAAPLVRRLLETRVSAGAPSGSAPLAELPRAKPPVRPVGVSSVTVPEDDSEDVPIETWISRENAKDRKKGRL